ncbi:hypothetical protein [Devosia aquimaris]|uniref:hypothetical protein n=1 Tax=Devosia aquimaris TaxID=2866214 RepID=UPI001CD0BBD6|nr:hypothetical protein [Devosia sp. CJK-A8-3]
MLPRSGAVLGVDIGWSLRQRSSAVCLLRWDGSSVHWRIARFTAQDDDRRATLAGVIGDTPLLAAAFDGPLRGDLSEIDVYRAAERLLSIRPLREAIGKLAQSNSGNGRLLNRATNACARDVIASGRVGVARHAQAIHPLAIAEAFPNCFLGLMLGDPAPHKGGRGSRSDRYYTALVADGTLERLLHHHLPGRASAAAFASVTNHDDRAALVCALTALGVAGQDYCAAGDAEGWIILPPPAFIAPWAMPILADPDVRAAGGEMVLRGA